MELWIGKGVGGLERPTDFTPCTHTPGPKRRVWLHKANPDHPQQTCSTQEEKYQLVEMPVFAGLGEAAGLCWNLLYHHGNSITTKASTQTSAGQGWVFAAGTGTFPPTNQPTRQNLGMKQPISARQSNRLIYLVQRHLNCSCEHLVLAGKLW